MLELLLLNPQAKLVHRTFLVSCKAAVTKCSNSSTN